MNQLFASLTKSDLIHLTMGVAATVVWLFGAKLGIPADAVEYAKEIVAMIVGSAAGIAIATPTVPKS